MSEYFEIKVLGSGSRFDCRRDEFLLEAMKKAGCGPIHYGCFGGGCGICKMRAVSGVVQIEKRMSRAHISAEEEKDGFILICCVKPRSDLVLEGITK
ncbi:MAG: 2Fe-2S iron-sulfur cluster binding domain-containing protein [Clostridiales bacterium]|jgi:ferredoxin|nr:2Fe-2S iron-sulfur cluster binding domain-containing protein [Clostridiales bacterium]